MLRKIISIIFIFSSIFLFNNNMKEIKNYENKIDNIIESNNIDRKYVGYISFLDKCLLINTGDGNKILDSNIVWMMSNKKLISSEKGNIILAGHNNKYVFSALYKLKKNDEVIISDFENDYVYTVNNINYINIKDTTVLDNVYDKKILTLITCSNNNQIRYVVTCKYNHKNLHK